MKTTEHIIRSRPHFLDTCRSRSKGTVNENTLIPNRFSPIAVIDKRIPLGGLNGIFAKRVLTPCRVVALQQCRQSIDSDLSVHLSRSQCQPHLWPPGSKEFRRHWVRPRVEHIERSGPSNSVGGWVVSNQDDC